MFYMGKIQTMAWQRAGLGSTQYPTYLCIIYIVSTAVSYHLSKTTELQILRVDTYLPQVYCSVKEWCQTFPDNRDQFFYYAAHHQSTKNFTNGSSIIILLSLKGNSSQRAAMCPTYPTSSKSNSKQLLVTFLQSLCPTLKTETNLHIPPSIT